MAAFSQPAPIGQASHFLFTCPARLCSPRKQFRLLPFCETRPRSDAFWFFSSIPSALLALCMSYPGYSRFIWQLARPGNDLLRLFRPAGNVLAESTVPADAAVQIFDILPDTLEEALKSFAQQARVEVSFDSAEAKGMMTQGLQGKFTVQAGLDHLLAGTGLEATPQADGYAVKKTSTSPSPAATAPSEGVSVLPSVVVSASKGRRVHRCGNGHGNQDQYAFARCAAIHHCRDAGSDQGPEHAEHGRCGSLCSWCHHGARRRQRRFDGHQGQPVNWGLFYG